MRIVIIDSEEFTESDVEKMRAAGRYFEAGILARLLDLPRQFGCYCGMRSTLERDKAAFYQGYDRKNEEARFNRWVDYSGCRGE